MREVTIIIPVRNNPKETAVSLKSILENTLYPYYKIIVVESESTDGCDKLVDEFANLFPDKIKVYHTKKEGITKAINFGISKAEPNTDIYLTQNDVIHPKLYNRDWLATMVNIADRKEKVGIITTIQGGGKDDAGDYLRGLEWVGTWSMYIPRETINSIGILDEAFSPGPGDDCDYTYRVLKSGLRIYEADFWVEHHRMCENFNDVDELCRKGGKTFRKKHNIGRVNQYQWLQAQVFNEKPLEYIKAIPIYIKDKKCLDYGCGGGKDAYNLMKHGGDCDICDITLMNVINSETRLKEHGWKGKALRLELSDEIPVENETYDFINCNGVLHHIKEPKLVLREFKRILKKDGELYVMFYTEFLDMVHKAEIIKYIMQGYTYEQAFGKITDNCDYAIHYTEEKAKQLFESEGFEIVESKLYHDNLFRIFRCKLK